MEGEEAGGAVMPQVCARCGQTYHDEEPRWDCACGPDRPGALPVASAVAGDDPATWYDHFTCFPADPATIETMLLRRPLAPDREGW